jgi:hypothetical protein
MSRLVDCANYYKARWTALHIGAKQAPTPCGKRNRWPEVRDESDATAGPPQFTASSGSASNGVDPP